MKAIIGKKVGMSQIFDENGHVIPVTVIEAGPCVVVQKKTSEKEGYEAVQLGYEDIPERKLEIVGIHGKEMSPEEVDAVLAQRKAAWKPKEPKYPSGVLKIFSQHAVSPMKGGYMK